MSVKISQFARHSVVIREDVLVFKMYVPEKINVHAKIFKVRGMIMSVANPQMV